MAEFAILFPKVLNIVFPLILVVRAALGHLALRMGGGHMGCRNHLFLE